MEYERIHKPQQSGMISPSKLRMKLIGAVNQKKKDGSNSNSSRTSPSRLEDSEFVNNSLLAAQNGDFGEEGSSSPIKGDSSMLDLNQIDRNSLQSMDLAPKDNEDASRFRMQITSKTEGSNSSSVHPVRTYEDENLDYDSTSSFEFHKGERSLHHSLTRSFSRPMPSKWNDAEKWIMNRPNGQPNNSKKSSLQNQVNRQSVANMVRVAPELENKASVKKVDFCQPASQTGFGKFGFASHGTPPIPGLVNGVNVSLCPESRDLPEMDDMGLPCTKSVTEENIGIPAIRSVSMRDMGTEMTPIPSQEPSRSVTPVSSTTPLRSPTSSLPSTPRRREPAPSPTEHSIGTATQQLADKGKRELSEEELKLKTRREIEALGVQLGKMNIAAWASKDDREKSISKTEADELEQIENAKRAAAWEEAEKSKHAARFKREEIRIQAWESKQKAKLEAEMRKIEAQIEQMRAQAQAKMVKKVALARQNSEEKRAAAEARKEQQAKKTAEQAEYIRQTGRIPSSRFSCCGWY